MSFLSKNLSLLTQLHSERPKLYAVLAFLSAIGLTLLHLEWPKLHSFGCSEYSRVNGIDSFEGKQCCEFHRCIHLEKVVKLQFIHLIHQESQSMIITHTTQSARAYYVSCLQTLISVHHHHRKLENCKKELSKLQTWTKQASLQPTILSGQF